MRTSDLQQRVGIETNLDFDGRLGTISDKIARNLDTIFANPTFSLKRFNIKRLVARECQKLSRRHHRTNRERKQFFHLITIFGRRIDQFDGIHADILHLELSSAKDGRQDGTHECTSLGHTLVLVESGTGFLAKERRNDILDCRNTRRTTNNLDSLNIRCLDSGLIASRLQNWQDSIQQGLDHLFKITTINQGRDILVIHQTFQIQRRLQVCTENLLDTLTLGAKTEHGLGVLGNVHLVLCLDLLDEMTQKQVVKRTTTQGTIIGTRLDSHLALAKLGDLDGEIGITHINDSNMLGLLRQVTRNTPLQTRSRDIINHTQDIQASDMSGRIQGTPLRIREPNRNTDNDIRNGRLQLQLRSLLQLTQEHGHQLNIREHATLTQILDGGTNSPITAQRQLGPTERNLDIELRLRDRTQ
eukprot:Partr_v1_DN27284_c0_g1_i1_m38720